MDLLNKAVLENASSATRNKAAQLVQAAGKESKRAKKAAAAAAAAEEEAEQAVDILIDPSLQVCSFLHVTEMTDHGVTGLSSSTFSSTRYTTNGFCGSVE